MSQYVVPSTYYKTPQGYQIIMDWYDSVLQKFPVAYESLYVDTRFGPTHVLAMGAVDQPPLVLLQGMAGSSVLWYKQVADFARHYRVYALDTVGQPGRSAPNAPSFFGNGYVHWLTDALDALKLDQVDLAGVCLGGWVALQMGIHAPQRLKRVVMLSPMGLARAKLFIPKVRRRDSDQSLEDRLINSSVAPEGANVRFDRELARAMALATRHYRLDLAVGMRSDQSKLSKVMTGLRLFNKFLWPISRRELGRFANPGLILIGQYEMIYNATAAARHAQAAMPQVRVEVVAGSGHGTIYDNPEQINPRILRFLQEGV